MEKVLCGQLYEHYKGKPYQIHYIAKHSETLEDVVVYECLYENNSAMLWVRPKDMFFSDIDIGGVKKRRFAPRVDENGKPIFGAVITQEEHRRLAVLSNNRVWALLDSKTKDEETKAQLLEDAYASLSHWKNAGGDIEVARAHWLVSRVAAVLNQPEICMIHAKLCEVKTRDSKNKQVFDEIYALESLARAHAAKKEADV